MYEAVHATPEGDSTVARLAMTAREYGYDGIVVRNHTDAVADYDTDRVREAYGVDVVEGVEIRAGDPSVGSGHLGNVRPKYTLVVFHGGTDRLNRFAVEHERIDVLAHPMAGGEFNHVLAKAAARNGVRVEFNLQRVLRADGGRRVQALQGLAKLRKLVEKYDVPYVVSADPFSHLQLRAPRELAAVGEGIGLDAEEIEDGLAEWGRLARRNRDRRSDGFIQPGVERGRYEENPR
jgi:ribonuclease P/MRP protein subunit RPP1